MCNTNNHLEIYYQNVRGLNTKIDEFFANTVIYNKSIICLTESWLYENVTYNNLFPPNYSVFRSDRKSELNKKGGGVLIAVNNQCPFSHRRYDLENTAECVWIEIKMNDGINLLIGNHYFPPDTELRILTSYLDFLVKKLDTQNYRILLFGDFNAPGMNWTTGCCPNTTYYYSKLKSLELFSSSSLLGLSQINSTVPDCNLLDLVFTNVPETLATLADHELVKQDRYHPPILVHLNVNFNSSLNEPSSYINYSLGDYLYLYSSLRNFNWNCIHQATDVNLATNILSNVVGKAISEAIPTKTVKKSSYPAWFSTSLRKLIKNKSKAHKNYKKFKTEHHYRIFSDLRKIIKNRIKSDKLIWQQNIDENLKREPKKFWKYVQSFQKPNNNYPSVINTNGVTISDKTSIANAFAEHFNSYQVIHNQSIDHCVYTSQNLTLPNISHEDVKDAIRKLKPTKSKGTDGIPNFIIKGCADILIPVLAHIFNLSLTTGIYPSKWKEAVITPVFKSGKKNDIKNYRPISILNNFSKLFEIIIHKHISFYINNKINSSQHGFIKSKSTTTNLISYLNVIVPVIESQGQTDSIYFDFSKAFDLVPHNILLTKMGNFGLTNGYLSWLKNYLANRQSRVKVDNSLSDPFHILCGVPQGSTLGPLLFLIFIDDICERISSDCLLFADDLKIFRQIKSTTDCLLLQRDIQAVVNWSVENGMQINNSKTFTISFSRKTSIIYFNYLLNNVIINRKDYIRDLGVLLDSKLYFHYHVDFIRSQSLKMIGLIRSITYSFSTPDSLLVLYYTLVRSRLEYASVAWNSITNTDSKKIENIQKKFLSLCAFRCLPNFDLTYIELCDYFKCPSLFSRRSDIDYTFFCKILKGDLLCGSMLSQIYIRVPAKAFRDHNIFYIKKSNSFSPIARCIVNANRTNQANDPFNVW